MNLATIRLESRVLFMPVELSVVLPDTPPAPGERWKTVWLLHGANGDHRTFLYSTDFKTYTKTHRCLIVMPSALNSDYCSYPAFGVGYDFPRFFFEELMPFIRGSFPASDRREDNYIAGASMGGYGALSLGLAQPERFAAIGALGCSLRESAFLAPYAGTDSASFRALATAYPTHFPTEYGDPSAGIKPKEVNVICRHSTVQDFLDSPECMARRLPEVAAAGKLPALYVACGTRDAFYKPTLRFRALCEELGVTNACFHLEEGVGHEQRFFSRQVGAFLDHFAI